MTDGTSVVHPPSTALDGDPSCTLVVPTYNAAAFIDRTIERLARFVDEHPDWRVLFVCDGCTDATVQLLEPVARGRIHPRMSVEAYSRNRGKGYAVRRGLDLARTPFMVFTDVDLAYDPDEAIKLARLLRERGADLAVVNRANPQSEFIVSPRDFPNIYKRHIMSRCFNWWLRQMLPIRILDTQAGLKAITADAWVLLREKVSTDGFFFDVDLLGWAGAMNMTLAEIPVVFRYFDPTTVRMVMHGSSMMRSTLRLRRKIMHTRHGLTAAPRVDRIDSLEAASHYRWIRTSPNNASRPLPASSGPPVLRRLIVTADDYGIGLATSQGIIDAHLRGPVNRTSVMVTTGDHVRAAAPLLESAPRLLTGLHLVFTNAGHPPLTARKSSGLVGRDGRLLTLPRLMWRALARQIHREAVMEEIAAQAELFRKLFSREPSHVDAHHHAHQLPVIRDALASAIQTGLLPAATRATVSPSGFSPGSAAGRIKLNVADRLGVEARRFFASHGIRSNDYFFGMLTAAEFQAPFPWEPYLRHLPPTGTIEWVVHPGRFDPTLRGRDSYISQRAVERSALTNPAFRHLWSELADQDPTCGAAAGPHLSVSINRTLLRSIRRNSRRPMPQSSSAG